MLKNTDTRYGAVTKVLHWAVFAAFVNQFVVAWAMLHTEEWDTTLGFTRDGLYEWHKSIGLVVFVLACVRYLWRRTASLPDWAPNLSGAETRAIHLIERLLYGCMFLMPISGFVFVMTGGYPIRFLGVRDLPQLLPLHSGVSRVAQWTHAVTAALIGVTLVAHWLVVARHQLRHRDRYVHRMLPFTHQQ
jgi:cytochrome b561